MIILMSPAAADLTDFDVLTCSPDGEPRGQLFRVGDIYPMDPAAHHRSHISEPATGARPFGMRYLRPAPLRAGRHEGGTSQYTTGTGDADGQGPEDTGKD
jgi:hypothetical protein